MMLKDNKTSWIIHLLKSTLYYKVRFVCTTVKLSDIAFLRRSGRGVDFCVNHTSSPIALQHEGCLLVYLQVLLLQKTGKNMIRIQYIYLGACVCACTSRDTKCVTHHAWTRIDWAFECERQKRSEFTARPAFSVFALQADERSYQT